MKRVGMDGQGEGGGAFLFIKKVSITRSLLTSRQVQSLSTRFVKFPPASLTYVVLVLLLLLF
jgi:hypothetical protein